MTQTQPYKPNSQRRRRAHSGTCSMTQMLLTLISSEMCFRPQTSTVFHVLCLRLLFGPLHQVYSLQTAPVHLRHVLPTRVLDMVHLYREVDRKSTRLNSSHT